MSLDADYPDPIDLKENELRTLFFLYNQPIFSKLFPELSNAAEVYYFNLRDSKNFNFIAELQIVIEKKIRCIYIGANIINIEERRNHYKYDLVSYSLSICSRNKPPNTLLRRFHFDYAVAEKKIKNPIPTFHLQYGGKPREIHSNFFSQGEISDKKIEPWLSIPRLNHYPLTLALLLDMVFCEFPSEQTYRISERKEWRALVKENEELVVKPYYEKINGFIQSKAYNSNCLIRDYCYGKQL